MIKPVRDRDEYVVWSTIVDSPLAGGTRDQISAYLVRFQKRSEADAEECMARVDEVGTSIKKDPGSGSPWREGEWTDDTFVFEQVGIVRRKNLFELFTLLYAERNREALDLLEPFDDEPGEDGEMAGRLQGEKDRVDNEKATEEE